MHDFAQFSTKNECIAMDVNKFGEPTTKTLYERVRHLSKKLSEETFFLCPFANQKVFVAS
jgi:hypothetical protein